MLDLKLNHEQDEDLFLLDQSFLFTKGDDLFAFDRGFFILSNMKISLC